MEKSVKNPRQKWYRSNWFIILMLVFIAPVGIFLTWKYAKWSKLWKIVATVASTIIFIIALANSGKQNVAIDVSGVSNGKISTQNASYELVGEVNASDKDAVVTVNGQETKRDGYNFSITLQLTEGDNPVTIVAVKGEERDEDKFVVVYQKPQSKAEQPTETKQTEAPKQTTTTQAEPAKQKTTIDQLWEASDKALKTRDGVDIQFDEIVGTAQLFVTDKEYWDEKAVIRSTYSNFVKWGLLVNSLPKVQAIDVHTKTEFTDAKGNKSTDTAVRILMDVAVFKSYNWENLKYQPIHNQLTADGTLYIHPAIRKAVDLNDVKLSY